MWKTILKGIGIGAVAITTVIVVTKKIEEKKAHEVHFDDEVPSEEVSQSTLQKIAAFVVKKVNDILDFITNNRDKVESAATALGIVATVFEIGSGLYDLRHKKDLEAQLDRIENLTYKDGYAKGSVDTITEGADIFKKASKTGQHVDITHVDDYDHRYILGTYKVEEVTA